ncbi:MAG: hypothetical protein A2Y80_07850 [Deltaproteobacteria bacterium RBG_13_58_19]|jgi:hypothetical protein|nr:MAG: hypothetical protein A2Y80_07850 [Deltaproteobacteria bacterium RBG_13_58_19]
MTHWRLLILIILSGILMACSTSLQEHSYMQEYGYRGGRGQGYRKLPYYVSQEVHDCIQGKINGRITRLRVETFSLDMEPGLAMDVQTADRGLVHVHLGPIWFLERQETDLKPGDEVTVQGFCYKLEGQERLLAAEVAHKDHTMVLRDPQGSPYWEAWRKK